MFLFVFQESFASSSFWDSTRFRARESFEILNLKSNGVEQEYKGFSNTINFHYEKPFDYSLGLAFGSIFSSFKTDTISQLPALGDKIEIYFVGFEAKYFFYGSERRGFFVRPGLYYQQLNSEGPENNRTGTSFLTGLGYEILITDSVSLAPELAYKMGSSGDYSWVGQSIALGVHFYNFNGPF